MKRFFPVLGFISLVTLGAVAGIAESTQPGSPRKWSRREAFGLGIIGGAMKGQKFEVRKLANGNFHAQENAEVQLDGIGVHHLQSTVEDEPVAKGGRLKTTITDQEAGQTTTFAYDPSANAIMIDSGGHTARIVRNPDRTYTVDGKPAASGKAAVAALKGNPAYAGASRHAVMLAYDYAQRPTLESRSPICCVNCSGPDVATPPSVCQVFSDFCDCLACDKSGKGAVCAKCQ